MEERRVIRVGSRESKLAVAQTMILIRELEGREEGYSDGRRLITGQLPRAVLSEVLFE